MKKITSILIPTLLAAASFSVPAAGTTEIGNIAFIGDSITQSNGTSAVSYRYQLWKIFVDNGINYSPVGSMNQYWNSSSSGAGAMESTRISTYRGKTFSNVSEGHFGWDAEWIVTGTTDGARQASTYPENTITTGTGLSDWIDKYYTAVPDTATILIGINDLSRGSSNSHSQFSTLLENHKAIVDVLLEKNPNTKIYVFSVLPSAQTNWTNTSNGETYSPWEAPLAYNELLQTTIESGAWGENVVYCDITMGFDPTTGVMTYDNLHPNAKGELILAGNMARALGLEQRTAGLTRKDGADLASQVNFSSAGTATVNVAGTEKAFTIADSGITIGDGKMTFATAKDGGFDARLQVDTGTSAARDISLSFTVKMDAVSESENFLGVFLGNGNDQVGLLYIGESGIYWGGTAAANLIYGCSVDDHKTSFMTLDENSFRVVYYKPESTADVDSGFYVWLGDQLIGEALNGSTTTSIVNAYKNYILLGDIGGSYQTAAELTALSFELGTAYAPISLTTAIPEPSLFGIFAGTLALALAGTCRRRRGK